MGEKDLGDSATYFEIMTLMAALAFKEQGMRIGIFEAGMGGRLDAVNALGAKTVVITPIDLDHQEFLGRTVAAIAREKAAVIHTGSNVIVAPQSPSALKVIRARARKMSARLWPVTQKTRLPVGLLGEHQKWNAAVAIKTAMILHANLSPSAIQRGLAARDWPGRFEIIPGQPRIILDAAHNPVAVDVLIKTLRTFPSFFPPRRAGENILIFGVTRDKNSQAMLQKLSKVFDRVILVPLPTSRGKTPAELLPEARLFFPIQIPASSISHALSTARCIVGRQGQILVTGSFYLVGEARAILRGQVQPAY